jgi:hypothetical protein
LIVSFLMPQISREIWSNCLLPSHLQTYMDYLHHIFGIRNAGYVSLSREAQIKSVTLLVEWDNSLPRVVLADFAPLDGARFCSRLNLQLKGG